MRLGRLILTAAAVLGLLTVAAQAAGPTATNALIRAIGVSGQIYAYSTDNARAAELASICEDIRSKLLARLGVEDPWRSPVVVVFRRRPADRAVVMPGDKSPLRWSAVSVSGFLKYQIEAETPPPVDAQQFVEVMVGTLCTEIANRKLPRVEGGQQIARVPPWLVTALARQLEERRREETLEPLKQALTAGKMPGFRAVTRADAPPGDPAAAALYGAQCDALLAALEGQGEGRLKLQQFLLGLKPGEDWMGPFRAAFGASFAEPVGTEKWWSLVMVHGASLIVAQAQTAAETRQRLAEALVVVVPAAAPSQAPPRGFWSSLWPFHPPPPKHVAGVTTLDHVLDYCNDPKALPVILAINEARLQTLVSLSHPLYRSAVAHYIEAIHWLREDKLPRFQQLLAQAAQGRQRADRDSEAIASYVGSVEASLFPEDMAKRFGTWFKAGGTPDTAPATPMKLYLDRVESDRRP
jgi:hypothetical protein